jgi:hypothetical protein
MADEQEPASGVQPLETEDGGTMHIHRPKPLHGARELLTEIGVIVVGIAIALAGEQAVEAWHWSHQTRETEDALRAEIQVSVDNVAERFAVDGCLRRQLTALQTAALARAPLAKPAAADRTRVAPDLYVSPWRAWTWGSWEAAMASGALSHVMPTRLNAYANAYKAVEDIDGIIRRERDTKGALAPLAGATLDQPEANRIRAAVTDLDRDRADILIAGRDLLGEVRGLGLAPTRSRQTDGSEFRDHVGVCK